MAPTVATIRSPISPVGTQAEEPEEDPAHERADDADDQVVDQAETAPLGDLSRQPAGGEADEEEKGKVHESHGFVLLRREVVKQRESAGHMIKLGTQPFGFRSASSLKKL